MIESPQRGTTSPEGRRLTVQAIAEIAAVELRDALLSMVPGVGPLAQTILFGIRKALADENARLDLKELQAEMAAMKEKSLAPMGHAVPTSETTPETAHEELHELMNSIDENEFRIAVAAASAIVKSARSEGPLQTDPRAALDAFTRTAEYFYDGANYALEALTSWRLDRLPQDQRRNLIEVLLAMRRELHAPRGRVQVYDASVVYDFLMANRWDGFACFDRALQTEQTLKITPEHFEEVRKFVQSILQRPPTDPGRIFGLTNRICAISRESGVKIVPFENPRDEARADWFFRRLSTDRPFQNRYKSCAVAADAHSLSRLFPNARLITASAYLARLSDTDSSVFPPIQQSYGAAWGSFQEWTGDSVTGGDILFDAIENFLGALLMNKSEEPIVVAPKTRSIILRSVEAFHENSAERLRQAGNEVADIGPRLVLLFHTRIDEFIDAIEEIAFGLKTFNSTEDTATISE